MCLIWQRRGLRTGGWGRFPGGGGHLQCQRRKEGKFETLELTVPQRQDGQLQRCPVVDLLEILEKLLAAQNASNKNF